jgi:DNA-binding XRE family transcriptional regulator
MKETLRQIWESQGLSQTAAARKADVSANTIAAMNKGETVSSLTIAKVCKALGITQEYLRDHVEAEQ